MKQIITILIGTGGFSGLGYAIERFGFGEPNGILMIMGAIIGFLVGASVMEHPEHLKKAMEKRNKDNGKA